MEWEASSPQGVRRRQSDKLRTNAGARCAATLASMEPSAAIAIIEADLRRLTRAALEGDLGVDWLALSLSGEKLADLKSRQREEQARRAPAEVPVDLLAYTHLYELRAIIGKKWEAFSLALGKKREFDVLIDIVEDYRNAPAHSRELLPFERSLLEGIAGLLRTRVVAHMSTLGPDSKHYPVMETIRDNYGNEPTRLVPDLTMPIDTRLTLTVGTVLTFHARGWDAQGRDLTWKVGRSFYTPRAAAAGTEVDLQYTVTESDVGAALFVRIYLESAGRFHRHGDFDHEVAFMYRVDPPEE